MSATTQSGPFSYVPVQSSTEASGTESLPTAAATSFGATETTGNSAAIPSTSSSRSITHLASSSAYELVPTSTSYPSCSYSEGTFFSPGSGQNLRAGQMYNISYFAGSDVAEGAKSRLATIGITYEIDSKSKTPLINYIIVPDINVTYGQVSYDKHGQYTASWTRLDGCGHPVQNFTWVVPTNLHTLYPNAIGISYKLFYLVGQVVDNQAHQGSFSQNFAIEPLSPSRTPTPTPKENPNSSSNNNASGHNLPGGAKAGIAVGAITAATTLVLIAWLVCKKRKIRVTGSHLTWIKPELSAEEPKTGPPPVEVDGAPVMWEANSWQIIWEADGKISVPNVNNRVVISGTAD